jgi:putative spermidine/putrescine transport system ATP-binding protein
VIEPAAGTLSVDGQQIAAAVPIPGAAGRMVRLSLRPEMISINNGKAENNHLTGTLANVIFLGSIVRLVLRTGDNELFLDTFNNPHLALPAIGARVTAGFPREACILLGPEEQSGSS